MTPPSKVQASERDIDYLRGENGRLSNAMNEVSSKFDVTRREVSALREGLDQLKEKVASIEMEVSMDPCPDGQDPLAIKPVPRDPSNPTDEEIRKHVLYELFHKNCWNGKHTSQEHLRRGYMAKVEHRRIRVAISQLRTQGLILAHGKSAEEHYSLNAERAAAVYGELGIPSRNGIPLVTSKQSDGGADATIAGPREKRSEGYVGLGQFGNTVRTLRESLHCAIQGVSQLSREVVSLTQGQNEIASGLGARVDAMEKKLQAVELSLPSRVTPLSNSSTEESVAPGHELEGQQ